MKLTLVEKPNKAIKFIDGCNQETDSSEDLVKLILEQEFNIENYALVSDNEDYTNDLVITIEGCEKSHVLTSIRDKSFENFPYYISVPKKKKDFILYAKELKRVLECIVLYVKNNKVKKYTIEI